MHGHTHPLPWRCLARWIAIPALALAMVFTGCSDDDDDGNGPPPTSTSLAGGLAGNNESGRLNVTIASTTLAATAPRAGRINGPERTRSALSAVVAATGTVDFEGAGGFLALSGTYDTETDSLKLSGGDYSLLGKLVNTGSGIAIEGTYTGPHGGGAFSVVVGSGGALKIFCGTYTSGTLADSGFIHLAVRQTGVHGFVISRVDFDIMRVNGTVSGTATVRTIAIENPDDPHAPPIATGTFNTSTDMMSGTWTFGGDAGTWEASLCD